jgi:Helicase conserved C-terminal domain
MSCHVMLHSATSCHILSCRNVSPLLSFFPPHLNQFLCHPQVQVVITVQFYTSLSPVLILIYFFTDYNPHLVSSYITSHHITPCHITSHHVTSHHTMSHHITSQRIDGGVTGYNRSAAIARFNEPDCKAHVFLLTTRAGGLGLNLQAANTVIIYDSDWNPQGDLQAIARCHRLGQQKEVKVYRLLTRQTAEATMFRVASRKLGLTNILLNGLHSKVCMHQHPSLHFFSFSYSSTLSSSTPN